MLSSTEIDGWICSRYTGTKGTSPTAAPARPRIVDNSEEDTRVGDDGSGDVRR